MRHDRYEAFPRLPARLAVVLAALLPGLLFTACAPADPEAGDPVPTTSSPPAPADPATTVAERLGLSEGPSPDRDSPGWEAPRKVVVADLWPGRTAELGEVAPGVELVVAGDAGRAAAEVGDADAVLGFLTPAILAAGDRLRWVQVPSAGVERYVAMPGLAGSDLVLTNAQAIFAPGAAEHALGMALALRRRLHIALAQQRDRRWETEPLTGPSPYSGEGSELLELRGRTMLVMGLGGIGTETARIAHGIGMRVVATRNSSREGPEFVDRVALASELLDLVPEADIIVNALPLTPATDGLVDDAFFARTKPSALYISLGRGRTTDTDALLRALEEGRIAGAGLDVTDPEPLPADHPLWLRPDVIITPHVGGDSDRHMERMWELFRENLRRFAEGEPLLSVVDLDRGY